MKFRVGLGFCFVLLRPYSGEPELRRGQTSFIGTSPPELRQKELAGISSLAAMRFFRWEKISAAKQRLLPTDSK